MFRTLDVVMIAVMTAAATVTYSLKHQAENKLELVRKIDAEIKLEEDTIDLLKADWALLTQPNRLNRLVKNFETDLKLVPTESTQLARPMRAADGDGSRCRFAGAGEGREGCARIDVQEAPSEEEHGPQSTTGSVNQLMSFLSRIMDCSRARRISTTGVQQ
jgi:hypothetical protein